MNIPVTSLPSVWFWLGHVSYALFLLWALWRAPWIYLKDSDNLNVFLGSSVVLWLFWRLIGSVPIAPGLEFHLLLVTSLTLMFGWAFAVLAVSVAQLGLTIGGQADWASYALNTWLNGILPIGVTYFAFCGIDRWLPRHFFIYIYASAFFTAAFSLLISRLAGTALLIGGGAYPLSQLPAEYFELLPIMLFPEAFLNGAIMTLLVVFRPDWVSSFTDDRYLRGK